MRTSLDIQDVPPSSWTRVDSDEVRFVERCSDQTDGVVISVRLDVPPAEGSVEAAAGLTGSELKHAAQQAGVRYLIDLETWRLLYVDPADRDSRDLRTPTGRSVALPLTAQALSAPDDDALPRLVRASIAAQAGAEAIFAPDFPFTSVDDPFLRINLRAIELTFERVRGRPVAARINVPRVALENGALRLAVERYCAVLGPSAIVLLTVGELRDLPVSTQARFFEIVRTFKEAGLHLLVDRAGDLTVPAVAAGAAGAVLGNRYFRTAQDPTTLDPKHRRGVSLMYFSGRAGQRVPLKKAREQRARGSKVLPACPDMKCTALRHDAGSLAVRFHNAHALRRELWRVHEMGLEQMIRIWRGASLKHQREWAQAFDETNAASEEA